MRTEEINTDKLNVKKAITKILSLILVLTLVIGMVPPASAWANELTLHMYLPLTVTSSWTSSSGLANNRRYLSPNAQKAATIHDSERGGTLYWSDDILVTPDSSGTVRLHGHVGEGISFSGKFDSTMAGFDSVTFTVTRGHPTYTVTDTDLVIQNMKLGDVIHLHYETAKPQLSYHYTLDANIIACDINTNEPMDFYSIHTLEPYNGNFTLRVPKGKFDGILIGQNYTIYNPGSGEFAFKADKGGIFGIDLGTLTVGQQKLPFLAIIGQNVGRTNFKITYNGHEMAIWPYHRTFTVEVYEPVNTIRVTGQKLEYKVGEKFVEQGNVIFKDGETQAETTVPLTESMISGFDTSTPGKKTVTVTYNGVRTSYQITVKAEEQSLRVVEAKTEYYQNEEFVEQGFVELSTGSGAVTRFPLTKDMLQNFDTSKPGKKTVDIVCQGVRGSYEITVKTPASLKVIDAKTEYYQNDSFVKQGEIEVTTEGSDMPGAINRYPLTEDMLQNFDTSTPGKKEVIVEYEGIQGSYEITVKTPASLKVIDAKTEYYQNDSFVKQGEIEVTTEGSDMPGAINRYPLTEDMLQNFDTSTPGKKEVIVEYEGIQGSYEITVKTPASLKVIDAKTKYHLNEGFVKQGQIEVTTEGSDMPGAINRYPLTEDMLQNFDTSAFGEKEIIVEYDGIRGSYTILVQNDKTITIQDPKTDYEVGDTFVEQGKIIVDNGDGTTSDIPLTEDHLKDFDTSTPGTKDVTVEVDGVEGSFQITVTAKPVVTSIEVLNPKTDYRLNGEFVEQGTIRVHYDNGSHVDTQLTLDKTSGFTTASVGRKTVTVLHLGKQTTYEILVTTDKSISIENPKTDYEVGDSFVEQGTIILNNGDGTTTEIPLTEDKIKGFDTSTPGTKHVIVEVDGVEGSFQITVKKSATLKVVDAKTEYHLDEPFVKTGVVEIDSGTGAITRYPLTEDMLLDFDTSASGKKTVNVEHLGVRGSYEITVLPNPLIDHIEVMNPKTSYTLNESFVQTGIIRVHYKNETHLDTPLLESYLTGFTTESVGKKTVTVTYLGNQDTYEITVYGEKSITIDGPQTDYEVGDAFVEQGTIIVDNGDGTTSEIPLTEDKIKGFDTSTPGTKDVTVEIDGVEGSFQITVTKKPEAASIEVLNPKTNYRLNGDFVEQGTIRVHYDNGSHVDTPLTLDKTSGFTTDSVGRKTVTVSHLGKQTTYEILVTTDKSISIENPKTDYEVGDAFVKQGTIILNNGDGTTTDIPLAADKLKNFDTSTPGTKTVIVEVDGVEGSFQITVTKKPEVTSIEVLNPKTDYRLNGEFVEQGTIRVHYDNGSHVDTLLTLDKTSGFTTASVGRKTVTVSHLGKQTTYEILVTTDKSISIENPKTDYEVGDTFVEQGKIIVDNGDGTNSEIPLTEENIKGFDTSTPGTKDVTVEVDGVEGNFQITVTKKPEATSIEVLNPKTDYRLNSDFVEQGTIRVHYDNGSHVDTPLTLDKTSGFTTASVGRKTVTVSHLGKQTTYEILVTTDKSISIENPKTDYEVGDAFVEQGTIIVDNGDGTTSEIPLTEDKIKGFDTSTPGTKDVTVEVDGVEGSFQITVTKKPEATSIEVLNPKTDYRLNSEFVEQGTIRVHYDNGSHVDTPLTLDKTSGFTTASVGRKTVTVSHAGHETSYEILVTTDKSISIENPKTDYEVGDSFVEQGKIIVDNGDGTNSEIPLTEDKIKGFDTSTPGTKDVMVEVDGVEGSFQITVTKPATLTVKDAKIEYHLDEPFVKEGIVEIESSSGEINQYPLTEDMLLDFNTSVSGRKTVNVEYLGVHGSYEINVLPNPLVDRIEVMNPKTSYQLNEAFVQTGMIRVHYKNSTHIDIPLLESHLTGFSTDSVGKKTVTVSHLGKQDTYEITVYGEKSITIQGPQTNYEVGDSFVEQGKIIVDNGDGTTSEIPLTEDHLKDFDTSTPGTKDVTVEVDGVEGSFQITVTAKPVVTSIEVLNPKTDYRLNGEFVEQGTIRVHYNNGSHVDTQLTLDKTSGFTTASVGRKTVTVSYLGKQTAYEILVTTDKSISIENPKTDYEVDDTFVEQGTIILNNGDGTTTDIPLTADKLKNFDTSTPGTKTVIVEVDGVEGSFQITVTAKPVVTSIEVLNPKINYRLDSEFVEQGTIRTHYSNGSHVDTPLTLDKTSGFTTASVGRKTITVSHLGKQNSYEILVTTDKSITIHGSKTDYEVGDAFVEQGTIIVDNGDGTTSEIPLTEDKIKGFDTSTPGTKDVTVEVDGVEGSFQIVVTKNPEATSIEILNPKTDYRLNSEFVEQGTIRVHYDNGTHVDTALTLDKTAGFNTSSVGRKTVTVSHLGKQTTYEILVTTDKSISIENPKTDYEVGDSFVEQGTIIVDNGDGTTSKIPLTEDKIKGFDTGTPGTKNVTVEIDGVEGSFQIVVTKNPEATSIEVLNPKTDYRLNGKFVEQGTIRVHYSDGSHVDTPLTLGHTTDFTTASVGRKTVTVTYLGKQTTYEILVTTDKSITIVNPKTDYDVNEPFDETGKIIIDNGDGTTTEIPLTEDHIKGFDTSNPGQKDIIVEIDGIEGSYEITVTKKDEVTSIEIIDPQTEYFLNDKFVEKGLIRVHFKDGTHTDVPLTENKISGFATSEIGKKTITVTHSDKTTTYEITVKVKKSITIENAKTEYEVGDSFMEQGNILVKNEDGTTTKIPLTKDKIQNFDTQTAGTKEVIVEHDGIRGSYQIVVKDKPVVPDNPGGDGSGGGSYDDDDDDDYEPVKPPKDPDHKIEIERPDLIIVDGEDILNWKDHDSYLVGYTDGTVGPLRNMTRGEAATIFFRLLNTNVRKHFVTTVNSYPDVTLNLWCNKEISTLSNMEIIHGYSDGSYHASDLITRAQFAKMAVGFFDTQMQEYHGYFSDVSRDVWYTPYVEAAARAGIIEGLPDGTFRPDAYITRAEACAIVNRLLNRIPHEDYLLKIEMNKWPDNPKGTWFYADIQEATNSHEYQMKKDSNQKIYEIWTKKTTDPDWTRF